MGWVGAILTYVMVWTVLFFMALPLGVKVPSQSFKGAASSAPSQPRVGLKILWVTLLSAVLVGALAWGVHTTHFPLRQWLTNSQAPV
jgi:predicted secreted protein